MKKSRIVDYDETPSVKVVVKIRYRLTKGYQFQIWLHSEPDFLDYTYQLFTDHPILRWDNAPHYRDIPTSPHHHHDESGRVRVSTLSGNTIEDLKFVLAEVKKWIA